MSWDWPPARESRSSSSARLKHSDSMNAQAQRNILLGSAVALLLGNVLAALGWGARAGIGVLVGGVWNLASLWCLTRLLDAWCGSHPSHRRVIGWLLVKFPLLYLAVILLFVKRAVPLPAFGAGFTIVLVVAVASLAASMRSLAKPAKS